WLGTSLSCGFPSACTSSTSPRRTFLSGIVINAPRIGETAMRLARAAVLLWALRISAQSGWPYPHAVTDRLIHQKTPMLPPPVNSTFADPDFGSTMVRVTDQHSNFLHRDGYLRTEGSGSSNMWSADTRKFYVIGQGGSTLAYAFDPSTMT